MLILILIDVQYSQKAVFSFEKGSNGQNHSSSSSHHPVKKFPLERCLIPLPLLTAIWKTLKNFAKFTGKHPCQSPFFNKVAGLQTVNFANF